MALIKQEKNAKTFLLLDLDNQKHCLDFVRRYLSTTLI
jgi:hypothetical protein